MLVFAPIQCFQLSDEQGVALAMKVETPVYFSCPFCNLIFRTKQVRTTEHAIGKFQCVKCQAVVHSWAGNHDYLLWKPIAQKNRDALGNHMRKPAGLRKRERGTEAPRSPGKVI
jgi:predicted RNA-binding Zn-ribbon protein involved in translation (DUF1610 family)